jgi:RNA polymerase sigma factor (sigma-70 family)
MKLFLQHNEQNIIERIKANDRTVLGEIFIRYEKMIFSYIKTHGGSNADAEDVLQESIIVLWQNVCSGSFKLTSKIGTYLMGVAKNKWREELRKRSRISSINEQADFPDDEKKVMDIILTQEKVKLIQRALNALSPLCKKLLMLFYFEERSMDEIANILEFANTDVVKSKKYQCKKALEETLRKLEGDVNGL